MRKAAVFGAMSMGLLGCATSFRPVESVAAEVKHDEVAAAVKMRNEEVGLEGRVKSKGLKTEKVTKAKVTAFPAPLGFGTTEVVLDDKNVGYVELESTSSRPGRALCLFESWALEKLATVQQGQPVRLACQFARVEGDAADRYAVFRNCWVQE